jgi:hypothetical protein
MTLPSPCQDCDRASRELWHGITAECKGCAARSIARSPQFFRVRKRLNANDPAYLAMLAAVFDVDPKDKASWWPAHEHVKTAFGSDAMYSTWKAGAAA